MPSLHVKARGIVNQQFWDSLFELNIKFNTSTNYYSRTLKSKAKRNNMHMDAASGNLLIHHQTEI
jgi:hypothetical protein